jgi:hypothetical protein
VAERALTSGGGGNASQNLMAHLKTMAVSKCNRKSTQGRSRGLERLDGGGVVIANGASGVNSGYGSEFVHLVLGEGGEDGAKKGIDGGGAERLAELKASVGSTGPAGRHPAGYTGVRAPRGGHGLRMVGQARAQRAGGGDRRGGRAEPASAMGRERRGAAQ